MRYDEFVASRLLRYAVMLTGDTHLAQDLVRETMVRVQLKWRRVVAAAAAALDTVIMLDDAPAPGAEYTPRSLSPVRFPLKRGKLTGESDLAGRVDVVAGQWNGMSRHGVHEHTFSTDGYGHPRGRDGGRPCSHGEPGPGGAGLRWRVRLGRQQLR